ncbi:2-methylthioadenine synthetase [Candidatus Woesearchaeota archaeon CG10_big_fil_rev_8_21_14_0_10_45_16]|nr:MAG: 2-methylthioadenine synthetase [Candidatus Woesearchaeota archaeon CG10_big_fil_rev_8_21_14_0_10_45_16]
MTSFYIETYGCSHNFSDSDSERMAGLLKEARFEHKESLEDADIIVFNTCTVEGPTADAFFTRLESIKKEHPYKLIIITGCIPQTDPERLKGFALVGTKAIHCIVEVVEEALNNNTVQMLEAGEMPPLDLPKVRKNPIVEIIPLNLGCLNACTFCKTKSARGNLTSYPTEEIINLAKRSVKEGVKEIWLTSQDTMCYGFDIKTNLAELLQKLVEIPGDFKIRVGMGNPVHLLKIKDELIPLFNHPKVFKFIHLPMQAGSDKVLRDMQRGNTTDEFLNLVKRVKEEIPHITLATDIIVGFPTETEDDFWQTLEVVRKTSPDIISMSRFWPQPKTPAAEMEPIPLEEMKRRTKVLMDIFHNISTLQNERWLGWQGEILIDEKGTQENQWIGRNEAYKQVLVDGNFSLGQKVKVRIDKTTTFDLKGKVLDQPPQSS